MLQNKRVICIWICVVWLAVLAGCSGAQGRFSVRDNYTKTDVSIPMRDGKKLYTVIFAPKDGSKTYPIVMERTPYSVPYGPDNFPGSIGPSAHFAESGYIVVYQDVRGRYMSEGDYVNMRPELGSRHRQDATSTRAPTPTIPSTG